MVYRLRFIVTLAILAALSVKPSLADDVADCSKFQGDEAITACTRIIERGEVKGADLALVYNNRGIVHRLRRDYDRALADLSEAIRLDPNSSEGYRHRGWTYVLKREADRAIADLDVAIRLSPNVPVLFNDRGFAYRLKRDFERALSDFSGAIRLNPKLTVAFNNRAIVHYLRGDFDAAIADSSEAIRLEPNSPEGYRQRGWTYVLKRDPDRAIADIDVAIRLSPKFAILFNDRGVAYKLKGDFDRAIGEYSEAIRLDPKLVAALENRGLLYEARGDFEKARADFLAVLAINAQQESAIERVRRIEQRLATRPQPGTTENRVALVIANSAYVKVSQFANPRNDAEKVAAALKRSGFTQVTLAFDLPAAKLRETLKTFAAQANRADWAIIYYAGHGIEVDGVNYLVPVDASLASDRDVASQAVEAQRALLSVEGARKLRLVILDACRDNPFAKTMKRSPSGASIGRGLAEIEPDGATLVAFAAKHGQQAEDGEGGNSPFVTALVQHIETPGIEINFLFRKVRDDVIKVTSRRQEPYTYGSLPAEELYFRKR